MTATEIIKRLKKEGWKEVNTKGSHIQFSHLQKSGEVTVPNHSGDIKKGTLNSILKQAGWK
ncbi:type II toxin-antitoxin system HicA family toxin [Eubacterium aggregans]|uniref:type II toxin-antitoxin system HicA family toxin n=1 Tax=Eubacterium aggregans TaxID=81409 RepID=UPI003F37A157